LKRFQPGLRARAGLVAPTVPTLARDRSLGAGVYRYAGICFLPYSD
jgi:hypothetical protein